MAILFVPSLILLSMTQVVVRKSHYYQSTRLGLKGQTRWMTAQEMSTIYTDILVLKAHGRWHYSQVFLRWSQCYYLLSKIIEEETNTLPQIVLITNKIFKLCVRTHMRALSRGQEPVDWRKTLVFAPEEVIEKPLQVTKQLIPSLEIETRMIMRDHLKTRLPYIKTKSVSNTLCRDTFFSSITSTRGFKWFNIRCYKLSELDVVHLMKWKK